MSLTPGSMLTLRFFQGQLANFSRAFLAIRLLDTPDHFVYDSACTMILNLGQAFCSRSIFSERWRIDLI
jgi:hypothetical protein